MLDIPNLVKEVHGIDPLNIPPELLGGNELLILKGVARNWPLRPTGFIFTTKISHKSDRLRLDDVLDKTLECKEGTNPATFYVGSTTVDVCLPGFREQNDLTIPFADALVSIWIGNKSRIACHYDAPDNLACSLVGKRRFTVFPPEQIENLYPGPLDFNPAGQQISLVDFAKPDFEKFLRFRQAMAPGQVANLEPGDALYIPSM